MTGELHPCGELAAYLTGSEASSIADVLEERGSLSQALGTVGGGRRARVETLLRQAGIGPSSRVVSASVLRAIEGAYAQPTVVSPVWTAPGNLAQHGALIASTHHLISSARESIVCSTYNFQRSSALWHALRDASAKEHVAIRIYVDTEAADHHPADWKPTTDQIAQAMGRARVMRTKLALPA